MDAHKLPLLWLDGLTQVRVVLKVSSGSIRMSLPPVGLKGGHCEDMACSCFSSRELAMKAAPQHASMCDLRHILSCTGCVSFFGTWSASLPFPSRKATVSQLRPRVSAELTSAWMQLTRLTFAGHLFGHGWSYPSQQEQQCVRMRRPQSQILLFPPKQAAACLHGVCCHSPRPLLPRIVR